MYDVIRIKNEVGALYLGEKVGEGIKGIKETKGKLELATYYGDNSIIIDIATNIDQDKYREYASIFEYRQLNGIADLRYLLRNNFNYDIVTKTLKSRWFNGKVELIERVINYSTDVGDVQINNMVKRLSKIDNLSIVVKKLAFNGRLVLCREIKQDGIQYFIYKDTTNKGNYEVEKVKLEDIIKDNNLYINAKIEGDSLRVIGLDGEYLYDVNKVYEVYKRREKSTKQALKHRVLGNNVEEIINDRGELVSLSSDQECVVISKQVNRILDKALKFNRKNREIRIEDNIKYISEKAVDKSSESEPRSIVSVHLDCGEEVRNQLLKAFNGVVGYTTLTYYREITPKELRYIVFNIHYGKLHFMNGITISNEVFKEFIKEVLEKDFDLSILDQEIAFDIEKRKNGMLVEHIDRKYILLRYSIDDLKRRLSNIAFYVDKALMIDVLNYVDSIKDKVRERDKELKENIRKAKKVYK